MLMKMFFVFGFVVLVLFLSGCPGDDHDAPPENAFRGIHFALVPEECVEVMKDVCPLFDCMVENCWCEQGPDRILVSGDKDNFVVGDEKHAMQDVQEYLDSINSEYKVKSATELNTVFYNIFAENSDREEKTFTIAVDGTIIKTQCGV